MTGRIRENHGMRPAEILAAEDTPQGGSSHWCCSYLKEMAGTAGNQRTPSSIKHRQYMTI